MDTIRVERDGHVLVCTIDRPGSPLNAIDAQLHDDLGELMRQLKRERSARAVVLTGSGRRSRPVGTEPGSGSCAPSNASTRCGATRSS